MSESTRIAVVADLEQLQNLVAASIDASGIARAASLFRHPFRLAETEQRLRTAMADANRVVISGLIDDTVVGVALVSLDSSPLQGTVGVIEELYVEPEAREVGVGEALLNACVAWCEEHNCVGIDISALPGDRNAKNLCERNGFVARALIMHKPL